MDQLEIRPVTDDEFPAWVRAIRRAFGEDVTDQRIERARSKWGDLSRTIAAFDGDRIVGTNGDWAFDMSLPDADPAPCAGVTVVGVAPDWRRRGVLSRMMRHQLETIRQRGTEPFAALYASESPIYGRFGYGIAAPAVSYRIERTWAAMRAPADAAPVRMVEAADAIEAFPAIYASARSLRGGMMSRSEDWWRHWLGHDDPAGRDGYSARFHATVPGRGYVIYRVKPDWDDQGASSKLAVVELVAADPDADAALWQFVLGIDLVREIEYEMQPPDAALPMRLAYRGRLREQLWEGLWLRLVDVGGALASRGYRTDGRIVFDVDDRLCDWNSGTWVLEAGDGAADCRRSDDPPDLSLSVADLAAISLGGVAPHQLAWAGRITERREGAVARAQRLFAVDAAPWNPFVF